MIKRIIADSSVDIFSVPNVEFRSVPLTIYTDEKTFIDDQNLNVDNMLDYLAKYRGRSYTSCPGIDLWLDCYNGADEIYVVLLSSNISGTYNAALTAAELYQESNPNVKIKLFDTLSAGPEVRLLVDKVAECLINGMDFDEVSNCCDKYIKNTRVFFALESFHNFAANGRVNKMVAAAAGIMGIRIMATASVDGKIEIVKKCRGEKGTLNAFLETLNEAGYSGGKCYIAHCKNINLAENFKNNVLLNYPNANIIIYETRGLCSFYAEKGGMLVGFETDKIYK